MRTSRLTAALVSAALFAPFAALADSDSDPSESVMSKHSDSDDALADYAKPVDDNTLHGGKGTPEKRGYRVREIPAQTSRQASARKAIKR